MYIRGCWRFKNSIFISCCPHKRCLMITPSKIFWFCSKFDHKLLRTYTSLVKAVLNLAAGRTRSCPRSLSLTLLKSFFQNVKLDLFRHRLMVQGDVIVSQTQSGWANSNLPKTLSLFFSIQTIMLVNTIEVAIYNGTNNYIPNYLLYIMFFLV